MKTISAFVLALALLPYTTPVVYAQLPTCSGPDGGFVFYSYPSYTGPGAIYNLNPSLPFSSANPTVNTITLPLGASGLTYCNNLSGGSPSRTFYTVSNGFFYFYNGTGWTNTGHTAGSGTAVNLGGSNSVIYNGDFINGDIYKYDGTGDATLIATVSPLSGVADLVTDCTDNFYYLNTLTPQALQKFNPAGSLIGSYSVTGVPVASGGGGLALIGNTVYFDNGSQFFTGAIAGSSIAFSATASPSPVPVDFAFCPGDIATVAANKDTVFYCGTGPAVPITATGAGSFTWTVLTGHPAISGSGATIAVTSTDNASIVLSSSSASLCGGTSADTVNIIVPAAKININAAGTIYSCNGLYPDTLNAALTDTLAGITYAISWLPAESIASGLSTLHPVINPLVNTMYTLVIATPASQGGCLWTDSVQVSLANVAVHAAFDPVLRPDCTKIEATYHNKSANATGYYWDTGNGVNSTEVNPSVIYGSEGNYSVTLVASNDYCSDTAVQMIAASFAHGFDMTDVTASQVVSYGGSVQLNAAGGTYYMWSPGSALDNPNINDPVATAYEPTLFTVYARTIDGCLDTATVFIDIDYSAPGNIPSAFTPNGDGLNDVFRISNLKYQKLAMLSVFNRWGEQLFTTSDPSKGWDGTYKGVPQEIGAYFYVATISVANRGEKTFKGDLTLVR